MVTSTYFQNVDLFQYFPNFPKFLRLDSYIERKKNYLVTINMDIEKNRSTSMPVMDLMENTYTAIEAKQNIVGI